MRQATEQYQDLLLVLSKQNRQDLVFIFSEETRFHTTDSPNKWSADDLGSNDALVLHCIVMKTAFSSNPASSW